jgi:hypothetical protein
MADITIQRIDQEINGINFLDEINQIRGTNIFRPIITNPRYKLNPNNVNSITLPIPPVDDNSAEEYKCKKTLFDLMTNLVSNEVCFRDNRQLQIVRFQYLVNNMFNKAIRDYITGKQRIGVALIDTDILFLYKGGTTMKILFDKYRRIIEGQDIGINNLFNFVERDFARSDSDYSIFINLPDLERRNIGNLFEEIKTDMIALNYIVLNKIRDILEGNNDILDLTLITNDILRIKLEEMNKKLTELKTDFRNYTTCILYLKKINKLIGISTVNNTFLSEAIPPLNRNNVDNSLNSDDDNLNTTQMKEFIATGRVTPNKKDFYMTKNDNNEMVIVPLQENKNIYLSLNESIEFQSNGLTFSFTLNRLKINFICYYITYDNKYGFFNCPSELVDVSIIKSISDSLRIFYHHGVEKETKQYTHTHNTDGNIINLSFNGYTIFGFINDLLLVLFTSVEYPWSDNKYAKRLRRLFLFIYLELLIEFRRNKGVFIIINNFLKRIFSINITPANLQTSIDIINGNIIGIKNNIEENYRIRLETEELIRRRNQPNRDEILNNFGTVIFLDKFLAILRNPTFINNINEYNVMRLIILDNILNRVNTRQNPINIGRNFVFNPDVFGNREQVPFMEKYLKYKKKYLELKKSLK